MVKLCFFAGLRETLGVDTEEISFNHDIETVQALMEFLQQRGKPWAEEISPHKSIQIAINQTLAKTTTSIKDGDEVAFFPPVTGG